MNKLICLLKNINFKSTKFIVLVAVFVVGVFSSIVLVSHAFYVDEKNDLILGGSVFVSNGDISLKIYAQDRNEDGTPKTDENGEKIYSRIYYIPKHTYTWNEEKSSCYGGAEIVSFSDNMFTISASEKGVCKVYFDADEIFTPDSSFTLYVEQSKGQRDYIEAGQIPSNENTYILDEENTNCSNDTTVVTIEDNYINISATEDVTCNIYVKISEE